MIKTHSPAELSGSSRHVLGQETCEFYWSKNLRSSNCEKLFLGSLSKQSDKICSRCVPALTQ